MIKSSVINIHSRKLKLIFEIYYKGKLFRVFSKFLIKNFHTKEKTRRNKIRKDQTRRDKTKQKDKQKKDT